MNTNLRSRAWLCGIVAALLFLPFAPAARGQAKSMPDVAVQDANGRPVRLSTYKGRIVLIDFWASWCGPCKVSFPALDVLAHEYEPRGVVVLAIDVDERRHDADGFLSTRPTRTMTVLLDHKGVAPSAFDVRGMPTSFIVDRAGKVRFTHMGFTGDTALQYRDELDQLLSER